MKKSNRNLLLFATIILIISLVFTFAACKDNNTDDGNGNSSTVPTLESATVSDTVTNGSFYTTSGTTYPLTAGTWTNTAAVTSGNYKTPATSDDVLHGVVSLWEYSYNQNSGNWGAIANPGLQLDPNADADAEWKYVPVKNDYNVLMIYNKYNDAYSGYVDAENPDAYMPKGTAYYYKSGTITLTAGRYYRLSVSVLTTGKDSASLSGDENKGAYINLGAGNNSAFYSINTEGQWQTYEFYVLSSPSSDTSATLTLGLGYGNANSGYMTQGYAFFDTVKLETVTAAEYYDAVDGDTVNKMDLTSINGDFADSLTLDTSTTTPSSSAPTGYSAQRAAGLKDTEATSSQITTSYAIYGTLDANKMVKDADDNDVYYVRKLFAESANFTSASADLFTASEMNALTRKNDENKNADSVLMLLNKLKTTTNYTEGNALGMATSSKFTIPVGKVVRISVDVFTKIVNDDADTNKNRGVTLKLVNSNSNYTLTSTIKNDSDDPDDWQVINTNSTWQTYSFYIAGSDLEAYSFTLEMWFGQGGTGEDDYHVAGAAFFDNVTFEILEGTAAQNVKANVIGSTDATVLAAYNVVKGANMTLALPTDVTNKIANGDFASAIENDWNYGPAGTIDNDKNAVVAVEGTDYKAGVITKAVATDPAALVADWNMTEDDAKKVGVPYDSANQLYAIALYNPSAYELTMNKDNAVKIAKNTYYKLTMYVKTIGIKSGKGLTIALMDGDDASAASFTAVNTETYTHYLYNDYCQYTFFVEGDYLDEKEVYVKVTFGSGTKVSTDEFLTGYAFISSVFMTPVNADDYNNVTTGTYVKTKSFRSDRGNVANGLFYKFNTQKTEYNAETGELTTVPGTIIDWNLVSETSNVSDKITSGIVNVNDAALMSALGLGSASDVYNTWYSANDMGALTTGNAIIGDGAPTFLYIKANETGIDPVGYKYTYSSLTSSTYYVFYVDVQTIGDSKASVYFTTTNTVDSNISFTAINTYENGVDTWTRFAVGIDVGMTSSVSLSISLYLGETNVAPAGTISRVAEEYDAANAYIKAGDAVMFDNVRYASFTDKAKYEAALAVFADNYAADTSLNAEGKISASDTFTTDGFETSGSLTTSTSPFNAVNSSNLTGSVATDAASGYDNVVMGVLTKDVTAETLEDVGINVTTTQIVDEEEQTVTTLEHKLTLSDIAILFGAAAENVDLGNQVIIINNKSETGYSYTMAKTYSLATDSYYEISIWIATYGIADGKGAFVTLTAGTNNETQTYSAINPEKAVENAGQYSVSKWQKYTFYVKNGTDAALSGSKLTFGLGTATDKVQGIAFFDNLTVRQLTEEEYKLYATDIPETEADENGNVAKRQGAEYDYVYSEAEGKYVRVVGDVVLGTAWVLDYEPAASDNTNDDTTDTTDDTTDNTKTKADFDWQYFSYIAISLVLVLAVVIVIIQRYAPKRKNKKEAVATKSYSRNATAPKDDANAKARMKDYDEYKQESLIKKNKKKK